MRPQWNRSKRPRTALSVALVSATLFVLSVAPATPLRAPIVVAAGAPTFVDLSPEHGSGPIAGTVILTARVYDADGLLSTDTSTHVRFWFNAGDPNDIDSPGSSSDLDCDTGTTGICTVSYVAANGGTDTICAVIGGNQSQCSEPVDQPELDDRVDVVEHTSGSGGPRSKRWGCSHPTPPRYRDSPPETSGT